MTPQEHQQISNVLLTMLQRNLGSPLTEELAQGMMTKFETATSVLVVAPQTTSPGVPADGKRKRTTRQS